MNFRKLVNNILNPLGFNLTRMNKGQGEEQVKPMDPGFSYMETPEHSRLTQELGEVALSFLAAQFPDRNVLNAEIVEDIVTRFLALYSKRPVLDNTGGSGFHNCFWLYVTANYLRPALIVESGVWKGQGSWILRQAVPSATIHGFDINLRNLVCRDKSIHYHEIDWSGFDFERVNPDCSLCFFDCHVNQAQRVREAYDKGFRVLMFDDNPPVHKLYAYGAPGLPTIDMLLDESIKPGDQIRWVWRGEKKSYTYKEEDEYLARGLIKKYVVFPDVGGSTMYGGNSFLSYVELEE